jgi:hypothetical protein
VAARERPAQRTSNGTPLLNNGFAPDRPTWRRVFLADQPSLQRPDTAGSEFLEPRYRNVSPVPERRVSHAECWDRDESTT